MPTKIEKLLHCGIKAANKIHDKGIQITGQEVCVIIPDPTSRDIYNVNTATDSTEITTELIIDWSAWRFVLSVMDAGEEISEIPILATARVDVCIPVGSIIKVQVEHMNLAQEFNTFRVTKNEILSTVVVFGRRLTMVPDRGSNY